MKRISVALLTLACISSIAFAGNFLEGQTYSRTLTSKPLGAPAAVQFTQSLKFGADWTVIDNANNWFGNPPEHCTYGVASEAPGGGRKITILCGGAVKEYSHVIDEGTPTLTDGAIFLKLEGIKAEL